LDLAIAPAIAVPSARSKTTNSKMEMIRNALAFMPFSLYDELQKRAVKKPVEFSLGESMR
jgi:hypothetical protein